MRRFRLALLAALLTGPGCALGAAPSIRALVEVTDIDSLALSPDGRFLVLRTVSADSWRNSHVLEWQLADLGSSEVQALASAGDPLYVDPGLVGAEAPLWSPDGRSLFFRAYHDGAIGIWKVGVGGSAATPLVVGDGDVESLALAPGGKALLYRIGPSRAEIERAERQEYDSGILVDGSVDLAQSLFRGGFVNGRAASERLVGYWFVRAGLLWRQPRQQRRFDLASGADEPVGAPEPVPTFTPPAVPEAIARSAAGDSAEAGWDGRSGSLAARLAGRAQAIRCSDPLCASRRISALAWRPGSRQLLVTFTDRNRRQSLYLWDLASSRLRLVAAGDGLLGGGRGGGPCAVGSKAAYCVAASAASPPRLVRIDLQSGASALLYDPNREWRSSYAPKVEQIMWKTASGAEAAGTLLTPPGPARRPLPLFVNYYSCDGFLRGGEGDLWPIPSLLDSGFAVACVNAVPFTGAQDGVSTYRTGAEAVEALVKMLARRGLVDRRKVAMGGFSFGSEVATWIAFHSNLLAALSLASAQSEPTGYWFNAVGSSDRVRTMLKVWGLGAPEETPERWKLVSPALNAGRITIPVLFQLPEQEARRVPELYARLGDAGTPAELYAFPDEDHLLVQPRHRLAAYQRNLDWLRYWLQDYRDSDPVKAGQYRRWDAMRSARSATP